MREVRVFGKIWKFFFIYIELLSFLDILDITNAISWKVLVLEARNF